MGSASVCQCEAVLGVVMGILDSVLISFKLFGNSLDELEEEVKAGKFVISEATKQAIQPLGQPLPPWSDENVPISDEEITAAIAQWDANPELKRAKGILTARLATLEEIASAMSEGVKAGHFVTIEDRPVFIGGPGGGGGSAGAGRPAADMFDEAMISQLPEALASLFERTVIKQDIVGDYAVAPRELQDGTLLVRLPERGSPSFQLVVHELAHYHSGQMENRHQIMAALEKAAALDVATAKHPLWSRAMVEDGSELWAVATQWMYGGASRMLDESSPNVAKIIREVYE